VSQVEARAILQGQSLAGVPAHALDIGCEGGRWSKLLSDLGWKITCIDVDREVLQECRRKVGDAECILADANDRIIPCGSSSFSLLLCIEVPPVIQSDWFMLEAARVLRSGGILVGLACNKISLRGLANKAMDRAFRNRSSGVYTCSYGALRRSLYRAGFETAYEEGFCWGPFGRTSNSPLIPLFAGLERVLGLRRLTILSPWVMFIARKVTNT
jgi:SAM-dependent methyltransferase